MSKLEEFNKCLQFNGKSVKLMSRNRALVGTVFEDYMWTYSWVDMNRSMKWGVNNQRNSSCLYGYRSCLYGYRDSSPDVDAWYDQQALLRSVKQPVVKEKQKPRRL